MKLSISKMNYIQFVSLLPQGDETDEDAEILRKAWLAFNGCFENKEVSMIEFIQIIQSGKAYTTYHTEYRKERNFLGAEHIALDFDRGTNECSVENLLKDPFIRHYANVIHTTKSHKPSKPRTRVVFFLDTFIKNPNVLRMINEAMIHKYSLSDKKCKDPVRFFWGAVDAEVHVINDSPAPLADIIDEIIPDYQSELKRQREAANQVARYSNTPGLYSQFVKNELIGIVQERLAWLLAAQDGEKHNRLLKTSYHLGGYIHLNIFTLDQLKAMIYNTVLQLPNIKSKQAAWLTIENGLNNGAQIPLYVTDSLTKWGVTEDMLEQQARNIT